MHAGMKMPESPSSIGVQGAELRSCVKAEVAVLSSPSLISLVVFCGRKATLGGGGGGVRERNI